MHGQVGAVEDIEASRCDVLRRVITVKEVQGLNNQALDLSASLTQTLCLISRQLALHTSKTCTGLQPLKQADAPTEACMPRSGLHIFSQHHAHAAPGLLSCSFSPDMHILAKGSWLTVKVRVLPDRSSSKGCWPLSHCTVRCAGPSRSTSTYTASPGLHTGARPDMLAARQFAALHPALLLADRLHG